MQVNFFKEDQAGILSGIHIANQSIDKTILTKGGFGDLAIW